MEYEHLIREYSIYKYVKNTSIDILYISVLVMIDQYNYSNINYSNINDDDSKIRIQHDFPKKQLVNIMRPYLLLYYTYKYSLINIKKIQSKKVLYKKLNDFYTFNPLFSRKQIKVQIYFSKNWKKKYKNTYTYNDKHIIFYKENNNFLTSHLSDK